MKIGELAVRTGASVRALRYYEEKGILQPVRTPSGYRIFTDHDIHTVQHIQTLLTAGLGLELIREVLGCMSGESLLLDDCRARLEVERHRMTEQIDQLATARTILDDLIGPSSPDQD